jgi:type I pantothenate kinase
MIEPDLAEGGARRASELQDGLERLAAMLARHRPARGCFIVGITGAVASGKSTISAALRTHFEARPEQPTVELVCTDGFLHSNAVLDARGLTSRKGFPESYDVARLRRTLGEIRQGAADFPGYSHVIYDVDPGLERRIARPDVLIIEGLSLDLDRDAAGAEARLLDALVYLDADEADIERWFVDRFLGLWEAAEHDPASFYARFRGLDREQATNLARTVWEQVNLPNLREHISGASAVADIVVRKGADHRIEAVSGRNAR